MNETFAYTWEEITKDGHEYAIELDVSAYCEPYRPAKVNALPEDCYPESGGGVEDVAGKVTRIQRFIPRSGDRKQSYEDEPMEPALVAYWERRFQEEVVGTDALNDWIGECLIEAANAGPDDDDRDDERWGI